MRVFIAYHNNFTGRCKEGYIPLLVGAAYKCDEQKRDAICDDTGNHISEYNDSYCELTGLYWIWKNEQSQVVGLVHYRRFFLKTGNGISFRDNVYLFHSMNYENCHIVTCEEVGEKLERYDLIVKKSRRYHWNLREKLLDCISRECLDNLEYVLKYRSAEEYVSFQEFLKRHSHILFNMFIGKKEVIDRYCEWLFPILAEVDQRQIELTGDRYHKRELGYLGEILFGYWIVNNKISYAAMDAIMPRKSKITEIDGVAIPDGTNVFPIGSLFQHMLKLVIR